MKYLRIPLVMLLAVALVGDDIASRNCFSAGPGERFGTRLSAPVIRMATTPAIGTFPIKRRVIIKTNLNTSAPTATTTKRGERSKTIATVISRASSRATPPDTNDAPSIHLFPPDSSRRGTVDSAATISR